MPATVSSPARAFVLALLALVASWAASPSRAHADHDDVGCAPCAPGACLDFYGSGGCAGGPAGGCEPCPGSSRVASYYARRAARLSYPRWSTGGSWWRRGGPSPFSRYAWDRACGYRFYAGACYARPVLGRGAYPWPSAALLDRGFPTWHGGFAADEGWLSVEEPLSPERAAGPAVPTRLAQAHGAHFRGEFDLAVREFQSAADANPTDAAAWVGLAHASFAAKDWSRSARAIRRAAALGAVDPDQRLDVEAAYGDPAAFEERLSALRARVRWRILDDDARLVLGYLESGLGQSEDARADLNAVLRRSPGDPGALCLLGRAPSPAALLASDSGAGKRDAAR